MERLQYQYRESKEYIEALDFKISSELRLEVLEGDFNTLREAVERSMAFCIAHGAREYDLKCWNELSAA